MLTLPDFKEKQVLFIQTEYGKENKVKIYNDNIIFTKDGDIINRLSCWKVFSVFIIGNISITSELIRKGLKCGVSFFLLRNNFEPYASINSKAEANYLLREKQYLIDNRSLFEISKKIVANKILNQFILLKSKKMDKLIDIVSTEKSIKKAQNIASLRGIEGNFAKDFFKIYFKETNWYKRIPQAKPDIHNFLLDMGYTMLFNFIDPLLNLFGFDTYKGYYHQLFFKRKSLTCDIIEPFRSIIDREVLKIFTLNRINKNDFYYKNNKILIKNYNIGQKYAKIFLEKIMDYKVEIYNYVLNFYKFIMDNKKNNMPLFRIRR